MKKRILALITTLCLIFLMCFSAAVNAENIAGSVTAMDGLVTINCLTTAQEGTPVGVFILQPIIENEEDVTAEKIGAISSPQDFLSLNIEYVTYVNAEEDGLVNHTCQMRENLPEGKYNVVFTFLGTAAYVAGSFEYVDVDAFLEKFNEATSANDYVEIIDEDINGEFEADGITRKPAKEILSKSAADITYYSELSEKATFCELFFNNFKPEGAFEDLPSLIRAFNETIAWMKLRVEADTLSVLLAYNGTGEGKYWNVEIGSDFYSLPQIEQENILGKIKATGSVDASNLEQTFKAMVVISLFRAQATRSGLENLIDENGDYSTYFTGVNAIIEEADLNKYNRGLLFANVLKNGKNSTCETFAEIELLFKNSIPEETSSGGGGGSSGGGGESLGSGGSSGGFTNSSEVKKPESPSIKPTENPFADVEKTHWANEYIARLYQGGAINGVSETSFNPSGTVQRQDFVKILIGALGMKISESKSEFSDVVSGAYYECYVMTAFEQGFISGTGDGTFGVGTNLKREDAAVIMARVLDSYGVANNETEKSFNDEAQISSYAKVAINKVTAAGIFSGDDNGNFNPQGSLTRAEACAILCRLADVVKEV